GGVMQVARRPVGGADLKAPGQRRWLAEQLLVEVVADPSDRLGDQQAGRRYVDEPAQVGAAQPTMGAPHADGNAGSDPAPDAQPTLPDRKRAPPVVRYLARGGDEEVDPAPDQPGREGPHRDLGGQVGVA